MMNDLISQRSFARLIGRSLCFVQTKIKNGVIPTHNKEISLAEGLSALGMKELPAAASENEEVLRKYEIYRLQEKRAFAELKKLALLEKEGKLVNIDDVKADAERVASEARERILSIPARYSAMMENRSQAEIQKILHEAIKDAMKSFQQSRFIDPESDLFKF